MGWCGEGLFAVIYFDWVDGSEVVGCKGYMDLAGNMAIDLTGKEHTDPGTFYSGLAVVRDAGGM